MYTFNTYSKQLHVLFLLQLSLLMMKDKLLGMECQHDTMTQLVYWAAQTHYLLLLFKIARWLLPLALHAYVLQGIYIGQ